MHTIFWSENVTDGDYSERLGVDGRIILELSYVYVVRHKKKNKSSPIAREPKVGGEKQTDGYRKCSDLSQCYKSQLDRFTQYKWTHLQI
jgi:hypothetical protein